MQLTAKDSNTVSSTVKKPSTASKEVSLLSSLFYILNNYDPK